MSVTISIMVVIFVTSILGFINPLIQLNLMLHPYSIVHQKQLYRILTADLVHNNPFHLLINEVVIYFACGNLESYLRQQFSYGSWLCLGLYLICTFCGSIIITLKYSKNYDYSSSGASGSAIGTMFSYMILQPHITAFYLPVIGGVPNIDAAFCLIAGFLIYQQKTKNPMINNELHLYSAIGGSLATLVLFHHLLIGI